jgi:MerR family transcriptional regulator, redox-sensitive transcriptional activator SoxR
MNRYGIGELARKAGVAASAIRYYEKIGLMPPPFRVNGRRRYNADAVARLNLIRITQQMGYTIAEIKTLLHGFSHATPPAARWQALAPAKLAELDAVIERARAMREMMAVTLSCRCETLDQCARSAPL